MVRKTQLEIPVRQIESTYYEKYRIELVEDFEEQNAKNNCSGTTVFA
jgi:hypothetical protein